MPKKLAILGGEPLFKNKIYVTRPTVPSVDEIAPLLRDILETKWLTNDGRYVKEFELKLKEFFNAPFCSVYCNGTLALILAIRALQLSGEVITTPFTFAATPHALYWNNITPVFCDIDPYTYNIDVHKIESLISLKTTGIMPVHIFGNPCDVESIQKIAKHYGLKVIYDAAHAVGVKIKGESVSNFGNASMFSFHATKIFNTIEGGAITCSDAKLDRTLRDVRNFGISGEEEVVGYGLNAKMNEIQAAFGILNLAKVNNSILKRKDIYNRYYNYLKKVPGLLFQKLNPEASYNYSYFIIEIVPDVFGLTRDEVYTCLRQEGVMVRKYFWPLCSNYSCYQKLPTARKEQLPQANQVAGRVLSLPIYEDMAYRDVELIADLLSILPLCATKIRQVISCL